MELGRDMSGVGQYGCHRLGDSPVDCLSKARLALPTAQFAAPVPYHVVAHEKHAHLQVLLSAEPLQATIYARPFAGALDQFRPGHLQCPVALHPSAHLADCDQGTGALRPHFLAAGLSDGGAGRGPRPSCPDDPDPPGHSHHAIHVPLPMGQPAGFGSHPARGPRLAHSYTVASDKGEGTVS